MASIHKLIGEIIRAGARLAAHRNELMISFGVTGAGLRLLKTIRMVQHPMSITGLARIMRVSRQTARETARQLQAAGFIAVEADPWNSRAYLVSLTRSGREHLETLLRVERRWAAGLGRGFAEPVRAQTAWVLRCVRERCTRMPRSEEWDTVPALIAIRPDGRVRAPRVQLTPSIAPVVPSRPPVAPPELTDLAALCRPISRQARKALTRPP